MIIGFTGHRNKEVDERVLEAIVRRWPDAENWVQGGAEGFDTQVRLFAESEGIPCLTLPGRPGHYFERDRRIVLSTDILIACYDGRKTGGTYYTQLFARANLRRVYLIPEKWQYAV